MNKPPTIDGRLTRPLPTGSLSYPAATNRNKRYRLVCPDCGADYSHCVTSNDNKRHVAKIRFTCGHGDGERGEFVRILKRGRK